MLNGKYMSSGTTYSMEIFDVNCNQSAGVHSLSANQTVPVSICKNSSGYGNLKHRNLTLGGNWVGSSLLNNGDDVYP